MAGEICRNCGEYRVITDADTSFRVCESCSYVHDSDVFQHQAFMSDGTPLGTLLHSSGDFGYRERKLHRSHAEITEITSRLYLSAPHAADVARLPPKPPTGIFAPETGFPSSLPLAPSSSCASIAPLYPSLKPPRVSPANHTISAA